MCFSNWYGFGGWFTPIIMMLIMLVFFFVAVRPFLRCGMGADYRWPIFRGQEKTDDEALGIAKQRYANGEISKEAFEEIKMTLS